MVKRGTGACEDVPAIVLLRDPLTIDPWAFGLFSSIIINRRSCIHISIVPHALQRYFLFYLLYFHDDLSYCLPSFNLQVGLHHFVKCKCLGYMRPYMPLLQ